MIDRFTCGAALCALMLGTSATPAMAQMQASRTAAVATEARAITTLGNGWRFYPGDAPSQAAAASFDDSAWQSVSVPHTWNRVGFYRPDPVSHVNRADNIDKRQGQGWYRLTFTPDAATKGMRNWLEFDAASRIASVWLNGKKLGDHDGGFSRFRLDATAALRPGVANVLVVKTDNSAPLGDTSPTADVLPLTGDFFVHGGLYRPVRLVSVNPVHIDLADLGGPGVYATTTTATAESAAVATRTRITNDSARRTSVTITTRLVDATGKTAATANKTATVPAGTTQDVAIPLPIANPHLWQGVEDPYLYTLVVDIADARGQVLDRVDQSFGIRTIRIDPNSGLFLNGKHVALHGVGYHQDREGKGWAIDAADVAADVAIMREMGVNAIRLTHYQHGQTIHDLADRYGLLLWDEIPLVSAWTRRGELTPRPALVDDARQQLRELIRQNGNHPSVVTWGIANEVDFGNSFPAFLTGYPDGKTPDPMPLLRTLQDLAHAEDPARQTALATCCEGRLFDAGVDIPTTATAADLGGANRYFGWYFGVPGDLGPNLDLLHAKRPAQPLSITEYGAGGATTIHSDNVLGGPVDSRGLTQPEEYESYIHEEAWQALKARPYLWGSWLWNSFDFATTIRTEGDAQDINTKGLVTYDRQIRKDAYYFYKANWSAAPTVYITGRRYTDRAYRVTDVRVYSNAATTALSLNGQSLGAKSDCPDRICVWQNVMLAPGKNDVRATGDFATAPVADSVAWTVAPDVATHVRIDAGALVAPTASVRFGSDAYFEGGSAGTLNKPADYGKPATAVAIAGTADPAIMATYRTGRFSYRIPLADGRYAVALTFVEPSLGAGKRVFTVTANGKPIVKALDIAKAAGAPATAIRRSAVVRVRGGALDLAFTPTMGEAIVSAIEISALPHGAR
jgi:beta-galactosidase